jgi:hypothetical protein
LVFAGAAAGASCAVWQSLTEPAGSSKPAAGGGAASGAGASGGPPRPAWVDKSAFRDERASERVYGVGVYEIARSDDSCPSSGQMLAAAQNRGRVEIGKLLTSTSTSFSAAVLDGSMPEVGWLDGDKRVYVLMKLAWPAVRSSSAAASFEGSPLAELKDKLARANRAAINGSPSCKDPYKRSSVACCGKPENFCSDDTRFDRQLTNGTCRCGDGAPCLSDFKCGARAGKKECLCQGPKCPCTILNCKPGQTCADGRCF